MQTTKMLSTLVAAAVLAAPLTGCAQPRATTPMAAMPLAATMAPTQSIAEIASASGDFSTLVAALKAAGLVETLQGPGTFTVFAPTNAAFAKLPAGAVEALLADKEKLTAVLTYHVLASKVMAGDIVRMNGANPATLNGGPLAVVVRGGKVYVNAAQVTTADIAATNGVIHVIDTVLMPPAPGAAGGR